MKALIIVSLLFYVSLSFAQKDFGVSKDSNPTGINKGEIAPNFKAINQDGKQIDLYKILQSKNVVLLFYRGYWCPYCKKQLKAYSDSLSILKEYNTEVIAISPETKKGVNKMVKKAKVNYNIVSDIGGKIMKKYKLNFFVTKKYNNLIKAFTFKSLEKHNGQSKAELPIPATYIIGKDKIIKFKHFDKNYKKRASIREVVSKLVK